MMLDLAESIARITVRENHVTSGDDVGQEAGYVEDETGPLGAASRTSD